MPLAPFPVKLHIIELFLDHHVHEPNHSPVGYTFPAGPRIRFGNLGKSKTRYVVSMLRKLFGLT